MTGSTTVTLSTDQLQRALINFVLVVAFFVLLFLTLRATWGAITAWLRAKFGGPSNIRQIGRVQSLQQQQQQQDYDADEGNGYDDDDNDDYDDHAGADELTRPPLRRRAGPLRKRVE